MRCYNSPGILCTVCGRSHDSDRYVPFDKSRVLYRGVLTGTSSGTQKHPEGPALRRACSTPTLPDTDHWAFPTQRKSLATSKQTTSAGTRQPPGVRRRSLPALRRYSQSKPIQIRDSMVWRKASSQGQTKRQVQQSSRLSTAEPSERIERTFTSSSSSKKRAATY